MIAQLKKIPTARLVLTLTTTLTLTAVGCASSRSSGASPSASQQVMRDHWAGAQPNLETLRAAREAGVKTVVNLRSPSEPGFDDAEEDQVLSLGMTYISLPIEGRNGITRDNAEALHQILTDPSNDPAFVHCSSGNRAGALLALIGYDRYGQSVEEALEMARDIGLTRLEPYVRAMLTSGDARDPQAATSQR